MASAKEIPPGGEGKIDVTFKTGAGSGGKREKHITVTSNDPSSGTVSLTITTTVVERVGISPDRINFNQVKKGKEHVRYASIAGEERDTTKITGFDSSNPNVKVEINPAGFEGDKYQQLKIVLLPTMRQGRFFDHITLHTDHKDFRDVSLNVIGEVTGDISLMPSQLHFGLFQTGAKIERFITVRAMEDVSFKILEVTSSIPEVTASVETMTAGKEYKIRAVLGEKFSGDSIKGTLTIKTDMKQDGILTLDIAGRKLTTPPTAGAVPGRAAPQPPAGGLKPAAPVPPAAPAPAEKKP